MSRAGTFRRECHCRRAIQSQPIMTVHSAPYARFRRSIPERDDHDIYPYACADEIDISGRGVSGR